jgi:Flp pilus assembly protein TadG
MAKTIRCNLHPFQLIKELRKDCRGAVAIIVGLSIFILIGFGALAVDLGYSMLVKNELQNAADAGALAGARVLYINNGTAVNPNANQVAYDTSTQNLSQKEAVYLNWTSGSNTNSDIERGHWRFATREFTPNDSLAPVDLWNTSTAELDENTDFINAVRVRVRTQTPVASFFSRIWGGSPSFARAEAVAYIGFAGTLEPRDVDQPIAICCQSIVDQNGNYNCATGRMINSSGGTTTNSAGWTNFSQPCETANANSVRPLVCGEGNPAILTFGEGMGTVNGMQDNVYRDLRNCWLNLPDVPKDWRGYPTQPWGLTLPVVDCCCSSGQECSNERCSPGPCSPGPCSKLRGAVTLDVLFIKQSGTDPHWTDIPLQMEDWECSSWVALGRPNNINDLSETQRQACFREFASHFNLHTADGASVGNLTASDLQKTMFFRPSCEYHEPRGNSGGQNFGILAKIPVLVK